MPSRWFRAFSSPFDCQHHKCMGRSWTARKTASQEFSSNTTET